MCIAGSLLCRGLALVRSHLRFAATRAAPVLPATFGRHQYPVTFIGFLAQPLGFEPLASAFEGQQP